MKLSEFVKNLSESRNQVTGQILETEILGVTADSREVKPGFIFVAIRGTHQDGHDLIPNALENGAVFVIGEDLAKLTKFDASLSEFKGRWICVASARRSLQSMAQKFYGDPSAELFCVGVTGTNGKTSMTYMLEHVFNACGVPMGVMGTINHHLKDRVWPSGMTTPDPVALQSRLREMAEDGARAIAMEVSSHALDQFRADGVHFNTTIFANLTRDHLDYHKDMKSYFAAKQRLFTDLLWQNKKPFRWAVVNADDPWGRRLRVAGDAGVWTYGQGKADFQFKILKMDFSKTDFELKTPYLKLKSSLPMCGLHNVYNAVAVIAAATTALISPLKSAEILTQFSGVPGRMQMVPNPRSLNIFVDYAHSPDALENVLTSLQNVRELSGAHSQIWTIFGCGGDRDKGKRSLMAEVAGRLSDQVMITSDNPRTENPNAILDDIEKGFADGRSFLREADRRAAIFKVMGLARPHDVILIAGKGHEDYQIIGQEKIHLSDAEVVKEFLG